MMCGNKNVRSTPTKAPLSKGSWRHEVTTEGIEEADESNKKSVLTRKNLLTEITAILKKADIEYASLEASFIIEYLTGKQTPVFLLEPDAPAETDAAEKAITIAERRALGEPLQYIFGEWDFYGMTFKVGKGVLIPRADTETIVSEAVSLRKNETSTRFADLCSGSGCIAAAVAGNVQDPSGYAIEYSRSAFSYLKENLSTHAPEIIPCMEDILLPETAAKYTDLDMITANPPYLTKRDMTELQTEVTYEPEMALFGGDDGLFFYREIARIWKSSLKKDGWLLFEMGLGQYRDVMDIMEENGYEDVSFACDLAGIERVVMGRKP